MISSPPEVDLTTEQRDAVETLLRCSKDVQTMGGYAGTGKTTVIRELYRRRAESAVCAYTGKAAQVLCRKGVDASTIHRLIYKPVCDAGGKVIEPVEFELRSPDELAVDMIIVDEGSMVPPDLYRDLQTFGVPLIFVGDHGQLEPVSGGDFNLMRKPDITLEQIHRNAGDIAMFAEYLRKGGDARNWKGKSEAVRIIPFERLCEIDVTADDQMICAYNKTRVTINAMMRSHLGVTSDFPQVGERVICLQNDRETRVFNGMQGVISAINHKVNGMVFKSDGREPIRVRYNPDAFGAEKTPERRLGLVPFDWAYCVTCHKAQGDEWDNVVVMEQRCGMWEHKRWAYTAASRAKKQLTWVLE